MKHSRTTRHPSGQAFTLIEVLAVVTIMGILLSIGGAALLGSRVGRDIDSAAQELRARLDSARWQAMTHRTRCRLLVVTADNAVLNERLGADPTLRTYAIARWNPDQFSWELVSEWHSLPEGLGFITSDSPAALGSPWNARAGGLGVLTSNRDTLSNIDLNRDGQLTADDELDAAWVEFLPDGSVEADSRNDGRASFWTLAIADGEVVSPATFQPRQSGRVRPLLIDPQTGILSFEP